MIVCAALHETRAWAGLCAMTPRLPQGRAARPRRLRSAARLLPVGQTQGHRGPWLLGMSGSTSRASFQHLSDARLLLLIGSRYPAGREGHGPAAAIDANTLFSQS